MTYKKKLKEPIKRKRPMNRPIVQRGMKS